MPLLKCTNCPKEYDLDIKLSGKTGKCNDCGNKFVINFQEQIIKEDKEIENHISESREKLQNSIEKKVDQKNLENDLMTVSNKISKKNLIKKLFFETIKSPAIILNLLFIIYIIISILMYNIGDLLLTIFIGIFIPLINLIYIKFHKNNPSKIQISLSIVALILNLVLLGLFIFILNNEGINQKIDTLILSIFLLIIPLFSLFTIFKHKGLKTKIKKILKWLFIGLFTGFIVLLISIYISSLSSYKESDFNISKDAFQTKYGDKDQYSEDNGFIDLINFINDLDSREDLHYFDILSKCIFDINYIEKGNCERDKEGYITTQKKKLKSDILNQINQDHKKNKISAEEIKRYRDIFYDNASVTLEDIKKYPQLREYIDFEKEFNNKSKQYFKEYKTFVHIKNIVSKKIQSKEYILELDEYSGIYKGDQHYGAGKRITFANLLQYSRGMRYVVYKYFENGDYDSGITLLLEHQNFIDHLINKTDSSLLNVLVNISLSKTNLETFDYFLLNYELSEDQKNDIIIVLENKIDTGIITNSIKREHIINRTLFQYFYDSSFISGVDYIGEKDRYFTHLIQMMEGYLFFSLKETELISDKQAYEHIYNDKEWSCPININNYVGRSLVCNITNTLFQNQYKKEAELIELRKNILEELKKPQ